MRKVRVLGAAAVMAAMLGTSTLSNAAESRVYFICPPDGTRVGNVDIVLGDIGWSSTPPGSFADGNGCGTLDPSARGTNQANVYDGNWKGEFSGELDSMTIEAYAIPLGSQRAISGPLSVRFRGCVDGTSLAGTEPGGVGTEAKITPVSTNGGLTYLMKFTVTNIGMGADVHTIRINLDAWFTDTPYLWVWGASEVPSGITFNPDTPAAATIAATLSSGCGAN